MEKKDIMTNEEEWNYHTTIKKRLNDWRAKFEKANCDVKLNYAAIAKKMEEDFHIATSPQKISAMFDILSKREVKLPELAALCQIFNIPMQDICAYPNAVTSDLDISRLISRKNSRNNSIKQLNNVFYEGRYYCYYFNTKHYSDKLKPAEESAIEEAMMDISIKNGETIVTLKEMKAIKTFYGDNTISSFTLTGKLYYFENPNMAYSFVCDSTGRRAMALMFTFINISDDIRYCIEVGMMTFSENQTSLPLFQKMAVFRIRQDVHNNQEVSDTVRGILALSTSPIIIDEETITKLIAEEESFKNLISPSKALKKCYVFSESAVRSDLFFIRDEDLKTQLLLKLRKNSLAAAHEIVANSESFAEFVKHFQQKQMFDHRKDEII